MIVGLDLHEDVRIFLMVAVFVRNRIGEKARAAETLDDRGIVLVGHQRAGWIERMRVADHGKQRVLHAPAVDHPVGVENLVPAVLGVGLCEHHQLHVRGIAADALEVIDQVIDLVRRQRQAELLVGGSERGLPASKHIHRGRRRGAFHAK